MKLRLEKIVLVGFGLVCRVKLFGLKHFSFYTSVFSLLSLFVMTL